MFTKAYAKLQEPGVVIVLPTDTVYGIVAKASDQEAVAKLYQLKDREGKPGTLIAANIEQLESLGIKRRYLTAVKQYWPGAVSVVLPCGPELQYLHQGKYSLAVRIPDYPELTKLLEETGPLLTSSANHPGQPPAINVQMAQDYFSQQIPLYVDGGDLSANQPSTIIRIIDDAVEVLRHGAVRIDEAV